MTEVLLELNNVTYNYGHSKWTLGPASLAAKAGELIGIVGPNGSGKSTLVKIAAGTVKPLGGDVKLKGNDIFQMARKKVAMMLGYLPQYLYSAYNYKVADVVAMGRYAHLKGMGFLTDNDYKQIQKSMELTEIAQYADRHLNHLSGGERQRVLLASVLCQQPEILLLDEPTTGLDLHHQVTFFKLLKKLSNQDLAIVIVTHDLNLASMFCSKLVLVKDGSIHKTGSAEEVISQETLSGIYPDNIYVDKNPSSGKPMVLPLIDYDTCEGKDE